MPDRYVVFHGHFYQPPRINPYLGIILRQDSAYPFHDWNEKIFIECYQPNTGARILNDAGFTIDLVNTFEYISFDFAPSVLNWLKENHFYTFQEIVNADKRAIERIGAGGAIACAYSHTILPLSDQFLRTIDIMWGLKDFEMNFSRKPDAIWLPETAVNEIVIDHLIEFGLKFVLLVPSQIQSAKLHDLKKEIDLSSGNIDPRYCYLIKRPKGEIKAFVAHGVLSHDFSFRNLLMDSKISADRIEEAFSPQTHHDQIISIMTDGETFGHHQPFAERGLGHLLKYELPKRGIKVVNFSYLAEKFTPAWEIKVKDGREGEGTAWSCFHGLGRWKEDCGCGKEPGTTQKWRAPLREAFNFLSQKVVPFFKQKANEFLEENSFWEYPLTWGDFARNDFFIEKYKKREISFKERRFVLSLFEMLKYTLFSFTSCAWFWEDISRIEAVANMSFALKAIQLYKKLSGEDILEDFLKILEQAPTNNPKFKNGREIFETYVLPQKESLPVYIAGEIIEGLTKDEKIPLSKETPYFRIFVNINEKKSEFVDKQTEEKRIFSFELLNSEFPPEILLKEGDFKKKFTIENIFSEQRYNILIAFWLKKILEMRKVYEQILDSFLQFESIYHLFNRPVKEIEPVIAKVMMFYLIDLEHDFSEEKLQILESFLQMAREYNFNLDGFYTRYWLEKFMDKGLKKIINGDFSQIGFLKLLFDIYFLIPFRDKENIYHNTIFRIIKENKEKINSFDEKKKQILREICISFHIDPNIF